MNINIFGSTGVIGKKSLKIIQKHFSNLNINLLCANKNINKLLEQIKIFKPKYVYLDDYEKSILLRKHKFKKTVILNFDESIIDSK